MSLPFTKVVASVCLRALQWMAWVTAALLLVLAVIAHLQSTGESPLHTLAFGVVVSALGGFACRHLARRVEEGQSGRE